jgi:cytochrome c peroxidase
MHDGRFWNIDQVLEHHDHGIVQSPTLSPSLSDGIPLTTLEKSRLKAFLNTLTDQELVGNPIFF